MKNFNIGVILIAFMAPILLSCEEEDNTLDGAITVDLINEQNINYTIQGIIYNSTGNVPLSGVSVSVADTTVISNEDGIYTIPGLTIGSYLLTFEQAGFQTIVTEIGSGTFGSSNVVSSNAIFMYEQSETLEVHFSLVQGEVRVPATNIPVTITLSDPNLGFFENTVQTINTDSNGLLTVPNLPNVVINLEVDTTINEETFTYTNRGTVRSFNNSAFQFLNPVTSSNFFVISGNIFDAEGQLVDNFDPTQAITITFNNNINPLYEFLFVELRRTTNFIELLIDFTISDSTLTISPTDAILSEGTTYDLDIRLQSIDGVSTFGSFVFRTAGNNQDQLDRVQDLALDQSSTIVEITNSVTIEFTEVTNASSYEIYANYSEDNQNEFVLIDQFFPFDFDGDGKVEYSFRLLQDGISDPSGSGLFSTDGASYSIKVRALNSTRETGPFADLTFQLGDMGS